MYQSEAVWICFERYKPQDYMIKIYVGGINAISGEPRFEDAGTRLRRQARLAKQPDKNATVSPLQDYIIVPGQNWLDGIADASGRVRQFVAIPFGNGHSVESQITGKDAAGDIQLEITPYVFEVPAPEQPRDGVYQLFVKGLKGETHTLECRAETTVGSFKNKIKARVEIPIDQQQLIFSGKQLQSII